MERQKGCKKCRENKSLEMFGSCSKSRDGKKNFCKSCISELNKSNYLKKRESKIEQVKDWQANNSEKVKEYKRSYGKRNR